MARITATPTGQSTRFCCCACELDTLDAASRDNGDGAGSGIALATLAPWDDERSQAPAPVVMREPDRPQVAMPRSAREAEAKPARDPGAPPPSPTRSSTDEVSATLEVAGASIAEARESAASPSSSIAPGATSDAPAQTLRRVVSFARTRRAPLPEGHMTVAPGESIVELAEEEVLCPLPRRPPNAAALARARSVSSLKPRDHRGPRGFMNFNQEAGSMQRT